MFLASNEQEEEKDEKNGALKSGSLCTIFNIFIIIPFRLKYKKREKTHTSPG